MSLQLAKESIGVGQLTCRSKNPVAESESQHWIDAKEVFVLEYGVETFST